MGDYENLEKHKSINESSERNFKSYLSELYDENRPYIMGGLVTLSGLGLSYLMEGTINPIKLMSLTKNHFERFGAYIYTLTNQIDGYDYLKYEGLKFAGNLISHLMIWGGPPTTFIIKEGGND